MKWLYLSLCCFFALSLKAQVPVIVLPKSPTEAENRAANVLQFYLGKMTGRPVALSNAPKHKTKQLLIFVGASTFASALGFEVPKEFAEDAFYMEGKKGAFAIAGGGQMGVEYAAYSLLELLGCRKYSPRDSFIPSLEKLQLPDYQSRIETPAFPYRELWYEPAFDASWARWHKLKTNPQKNREWGLFVHTFDKLCPKALYFKDHPEYFAFNGAQRSGGQLCLSNDTVFQIVLENLKAQISLKPEAQYWSVSQNDNYDYCKCPRCAAADRRHGSPAASLLLFVNRVAAKFPDKTISTLAYQYTRQAPKGIEPAPNVNICLCSIECNRGQSIEDGCPDFARDVREWSALTKNLMIWDYIVQFRTYLGPFPNWHTLQPNLQFFQENGVKMMFEQGSGRDRSEFSDMRAYLLAKLMWNPHANMDSILTDFGNGYYGEYKAPVWQYIHNQTERLKQHGNRLWIYDIPQNEAFVRDSVFYRVLSPLPNAEPETKDLVLSRRLASIIAGEYFSFLETLKCIDPAKASPMEMEMWSLLLDSTELTQFLAYFEATCLTAGIQHLNENTYTPAQYLEDYKYFQKRSLPALLSSADSILLKTPASPKYAQGNPQVLINHLVGETDYRYNWLGFEGADLRATVMVAAASAQTISSIQVSFLQDQASWVFYPEKVVFEVSEDGQNFRTVLDEHIEIVQDEKKALKTIKATFLPAPIRFLKVTALNQKNCPPWHTCNGSPAWIFADEIQVR